MSEQLLGNAVYLFVRLLARRLQNLVEKYCIFFRYKRFKPNGSNLRLAFTFLLRFEFEFEMNLPRKTIFFSAINQVTVFKFWEV